MLNKLNFIEELEWRGLIHDITPGTKELFDKQQVTAYIGFDPTADSLHIGSMVQIVLLMHLQRHGHKPIALVGGATGMVGDPSGKSKERNLLSEEELDKNLKGITAQLEKFLDFKSEQNHAEVVNNFDWFKNFSFLGFIRDVGKYITVNYMMSKDSVKLRFTGDVGISFTEFSYQLIQGYDFYWLYKNKGVQLQMGGSDQWGNITTGSELIRKMDGGDVHALTSPLVRKADGGKFGKTEQGNVWLDPARTSPYRFYQFWLNCSDDDAINWIKIFTFLDKATIDELTAQHQAAPHLRILQKALAEDITVRVHSREEYEKAVQASEVLFGKSTKEQLQGLDEATLLDIFDGVPNFPISASDLKNGIQIVELLAGATSIYSSKGEARRAIKAGAINLNQEKVASEEQLVGGSDLINEKYLLLRKGKKDYHLVVAS
jgi:tyrosyl-tRNA synthetase